MHIPGKPHADTKLVKFLELRPKKTQRKIAAETGFASVNMLAMIKAGNSRLPLDRVPALAKALDVDGARGKPLPALVISAGNALSEHDLGWCLGECCSG